MLRPRCAQQAICDPSHTRRMFACVSQVFLSTALSGHTYRCLWFDHPGNYMLWLRIARAGCAHAADWLPQLRVVIGAKRLSQQRFSHRPPCGRRYFFVCSYHHPRAPFLLIPSPAVDSDALFVHPDRRPPSHSKVTFHVVAAAYKSRTTHRNGSLPAHTPAVVDREYNWIALIS